MTGRDRPDQSFWDVVEELVRTGDISIDRPRGSSHPRFPEFVYPIDYGYVAGTVGGDREEVDVWVGSGPGGVVGLFCTVDPFRRDAEVKILLGVTDDEVDQLVSFYAAQPQAALLVRCPPDGRERGS